MTQKQTKEAEAKRIANRWLKGVTGIDPDTQSHRVENSPKTKAESLSVEDLVSQAISTTKMPERLQDCVDDSSTPTRPIEGIIIPRAYNAPVSDIEDYFANKYEGGAYAPKKRP